MKLRYVCTRVLDCKGGISTHQRSLLSLMNLGYLAWSNLPVFQAESAQRYKYENGQCDCAPVSNLQGVEKKNVLPSQLFFAL